MYNFKKLKNHKPMFVNQQFNEKMNSAHVKKSVK